MKTKIGLIVLAVLCLGLGVAIFATRKQAAEEKTKDTETIATLSNNWVDTRRQLEEQKQAGLNLEKDVESHKLQFSELTNQYTAVAGTLTKTEDSLKATTETLQATKEDVAKRDVKIAELEQQNRDLDQRALDLSGAITNLTTLISVAQGKLARSEGDRAFLEKELKRLMAEKAELERQFNDLVLVRAQVAKLREELNVSRRLEWIRKGLFSTDEMKGAQKLMQKDLAPQPAKPKGHYDLNVEVNADGSVRVIPPRTNAPATPSK